MQHSYQDFCCLKYNNVGHQYASNIPIFPLVARRFSQPGFGRSGGVENEINVETVEYNYNICLFKKDNGKITI